MESRDYGNEYRFDIINKKLKIYRELMSILKIKKNMNYNYDKDNKKFKGKITDSKISENANNIAKLFRFTESSFCNLDEEGGYKKLYCSSVHMCRHLFGNKIITTTIKNKKVNKKSIKIPMYYTDNSYIQNVAKYI